jgi:hypothetical protein
MPYANKEDLYKAQKEYRERKNVLNEQEKRIADLRRTLADDFHNSQSYQELKPEKQHEVDLLLDTSFNLIDEQLQKLKLEVKTEIDQYLKVLKADVLAQGERFVQFVKSSPDFQKIISKQIEEKQKNES